MNAAIVTIGQEILIGQIVDTNSAWMASELNSIGIDVKKIISISDSIHEIESTVNELAKTFEIILLTGGLGPTNDDITKQALCKLFDSKLILHTDTLNHIEQLFKKRKLPLTELNRLQAFVPDKCEILFNSIGTAPGMWFKASSGIVVSLPGVPFEMKSIMEQQVLPKLKELSGNQVIVHKTIQTFGIPESFLAEKLMEWENQLPANVSLAYLPSPISIRLRLSSKGNDRIKIDRFLTQQVNKLQLLIPEYIFGFETDSLSSVVGKILISKNRSLSVAESCTGGYLAHLITQISGSSGYFKGGIIAYSNQVKSSVLGVSTQSIEQFGAVSREVVEEMAIGARKLLNTDYAIATSGIAGPTGATPSKPVGLVCISIATPKRTISESFTFTNDRERNIIRCSATALNMLRLELMSE